MRRCFFILGLIVLLVAQSQAQNQHANQGRGFQANGVYSTKEIDSINLFNGNLNLNIPVGNSYRVSDTFSYSLNLVYNSHLWTSKEICPPVPVNGSLSIWIVTINGQTYIEPGPGGPPGDSDPAPRERASNGCFTVTAPNSSANAGLGWQLSLGKLYAPDPDPYAYVPNTSESGWVYASPDGSEHRFYGSLHEDAAEPVNNTTSYTRDGSYLRMKVSGNDRTLEFPDGTVHLFRNQGTGTNPDWRVVQMRDQFGNWLNISYTPTRWTLEDSIGRIHYVNLTTETVTYQPVVSSVDLSASSGQRAVYNFNYAVRTVHRGCPHVPDALNDYPPFIQVPLLTSVQLPGDLTSYSMPVADYDLLGQSSCQVIGALKGITIPTGARMEWDYGTYRYAFYSSPRAYLRYTTGVVKRRIVEDPATRTVVHEWTYEPKLDPLPFPGSPPQDDPQNNSPKQFYNKVTTPLGHYSMHYFSAYPYPFDEIARDDPDAWHGVDYGLPFTKYDDKSITDQLNRKLFLSTETYRKLSSGAYEKMRSTYVRYETDAVSPEDGFGSLRDANRRLVATRTVYHDDDEFDEKFAETRYEDFDGLGHYRSQTTGGNFGSGNVRTETTRYNPTRGTYKIDPTDNGHGAGHNYTPFPENFEWVLGTYDEQTALQGTSKSVVEFYFDQQGLLKRKRVLKNGQATTAPLRSTQDVLVDYRHENGNVTSERYYGGDKQAGLNTSAALSNLILPPEPEYQINHTYQYGVLETSQYKLNDSTDAVPYKSVDQDVGFNTGFIIASRDTAGVQTTYKYDVLGRITNIQRSKGSWTDYVYTPASATAEAKVNVYSRPKGGGAPILSEEEYVYDTLGRLRWEKRKMPDSSIMSRETLYNSMGWKVSVSEFGSANKKTQYLNYDPFGRPGLIRPSDGSTHDVTLSYKGVREINRTVKLGTSYSGGVVNEEAVASTEFYDRQGRLDGVKERSGIAGAEVTSNYLYDVGNRLRQARTTEDVEGGSAANVALASNGAIASASSTVTSDFPASAAINGDRKGQNWGHGGGWNDGSQGVYSTDWVQVNFTGEKEVSEVRVYTLRDGYDWKIGDPSFTETFQNADNTGKGVVDYDVQYLSGQGWKTVPGGRVIGNNLVGRRVAFSQVRTTAVRVAVHKAVTFTTSANNYSRIVEVEAWGNASLNSSPSGNLALGKTATQSSTVVGAVASRAVDGNRDGNFFNHSVTHTDYQNQPWWQVDLGSVQAIGQIRLWNRTDCACPERLENFYVFVSDAPFTSTDVTATRNQPGVSSYYTPGGAGPTLTLNVGRTGRYVRVQLGGVNPLSLAEVEVWADNLALGKTATQSSTVVGAVASRAIDGNRDGNFFNHSVTHTDYQNQPWWQVDLGSVQAIGQIRLWNRTDCACPERLENFYAFVSDAPFTSTDVTATRNQPGVSSYYTPGGAGPGLTLNVGRTGRYVRVQLAGVNPLSLAEVEVWAGDLINLAREAGATALASSQASSLFPVSAIIDGDRTGKNWGKGGYASGWSDATESQFSSDWLQVNFAGNKTIDRINVFTLRDGFNYRTDEPTMTETFVTADSSGSGITYFELQSWNGTRWMPIPGCLIGGATDNNLVWRQCTFAPLTTSAVRVAVRNAVVWTVAANNHSRIVELEAYESSASAPSTVIQTRTFTYDNRGFLISETHPELGSGTGGSIQYGSYDSRGHTGTKSDGTNNLRYTYDKAARPTLIEDKSVSGTYRPLKEYFYYPTNDAGTQDWRLGKLEKAIRHNYTISPYSGTEIDVIVSELYQYRGIDGLMSERVTTTNSGGYLFRQSFVHDALGNLQSQTYPKCEHQTCVQSPAATASRTVNYSYSQGMLTGVTNYATIGYHPNGTINTVAHTNAVTDTHALDTNFMQRPASITTTGANLNWSSGLYKYDGAGNVKTIGSDRYVYDRVGRVVEGTALAGNSKKQKYSYDAFGNVKTISTYTQADNAAETPATRFTNANSATNRLAESYDAAGNQLTLNGFSYAYDSLNMLKTAAGKKYIYTPSEELFWTYDASTSPAVETFTLRGIDGKVLREYVVIGGNTAGNWSWKKDYIYRGTQLVASESPGGRLHYTLDHLGSPRLITNNSAQRLALHQYFPFGEEATSPYQDSEKAKFTGHERETYFSGAPDLDYMHARFYGPSHGRFLSIDPGRDFDPKQPQSWNLYSYVRNGPVSRTDPTGRCSQTAGIGSGEVGICLEAFIGAAHVRGVALGDDRTFSANDPSLTSRVMVQLIVNPKLGTVRYGPFSPSFGISKVGFKFLPGKPGSGAVSVSAGRPVASASNSSQGFMTIRVQGDAVNGFQGWPGSPRGAISFDATFIVTTNGKIGLLGGGVDGYPSYGAYGYDKDGRVVKLFEVLETTVDELLPPLDVKLPPVSPTRPR